jgi:flagellar motility protein MotE (MotC chaperone)
MKKKLILIGVFVLIAGGSFCASYIAAQMFIKPETPGQQTPGAAGTLDPIAQADQQFMSGLTGASKTPLKPKEQQLDELIREVRARLKQLDSRHRELNEREKQLSIAQEQLRMQAESLEQLRMDLVAAINPLREAQKELLRDKTLIRSQEIQRLEETARMYTKMDPANAARILLEMYKNRQQAAVVKIIHFLPEKNWAAIMDEMQELGPAAEMILRQLQVVVRTNQS